MLVKIAIIIELISILFCLNKMFGKTRKKGISSLIVGIALFIVLDIINWLKISWLYTFTCIFVLFLYYLLKYKEGICNTTVVVVVGFLIQLIIQFISVLIVSLFKFSDPIQHSFYASLISGILTFSVLPFCRLNQIKESIVRRHWLVYVIFSFICFFICIILLQGKLENGVRIGIYIFAIPSFIIIIMLIINWNKSVLNEKKAQKERDLIMASQNDYDSLVETVKINNHGIKNHLSAVYATQYTYKNYDERVEMQKQYCDKILYENKYNKILMLENKTLSGFIYGKIKELENKEIAIEFNINTNLKDAQLPTYYLVEIIGILIDNAVEAISDDKRIYMYFDRHGFEYKFVIRNVYKKTTYNEIQKWFIKDVSEKGVGRGLGLYRVKKLCEEWKCSICCKNVMIEGEDWIEFELIFR